MSSNSRVRDPPASDRGCGNFARLHPCWEVQGAEGDARAGVEGGEKPVGKVHGPPQEGAIVPQRFAMNEGGAVGMRGRIGGARAASFLLRCPHEYREIRT